MGGDDAGRWRCPHALSSTLIRKSFGWVSDRYGVSWQRNLRKA
ncbi:hypothetical protein EDM59_23895 [Brevibacillus nitrificans]|uniref:Uncharacterized protein n=1 Tax=Brevibacillus nitrificans TaxID=651560 RepID=A0A3M8CY35_9BACL|nr:hypothetical protein EDM59_23895 [Brevibacillus nitrificans]